MEQKPQILIFGYGNPGRQDDGLGAAFIARMEEWLKVHPNEHIHLDTNYQLNIEDAEQISTYDKVLFVDASLEPIEGFNITKVLPSEAKVEFTMHAVSPAFVLDLCQKIFHRTPETYLLHIKGYEWEFIEQLTDEARANLDAAFAYVSERLAKNPDQIEFVDQ